MDLDKEDPIFEPLNIHRMIDLDPPSPEMIKEFFRMNGLTGSAAAEILHVTPRAVRKWTSPQGTSNHTTIPYSAWWMLVKTMESRVTTWMQTEMGTE